jgi:E3 ubiquitin-protein ligase HUWE1
MVEQQRKRAPPEVVEQFRLAALLVLEDLASQLEPLWQQLSQVASTLEAALKASKSAEATKVLPPAAAQVQPLVECFFVLADVQSKLKPPAEGDKGQLSSSGERAASLSMDVQSPTVSQLSISSSMPAMGGGAPAASPTAESQPAFMRFAERHRRLVNALVHHKPQLLQTSLALLLRAPKLLDFDNKRAYFRTQVKENEAQHYGTLRLHVRREHVFEDSFYQLRMRTPEEMRAKLNVVFTGEEGVDAGGVTREWYSVISREMFNPQFSLFQPVPEGGTTFQPNPNSIIQNDEARGTNHLDFFRFVGRVVGKASEARLGVGSLFCSQQTAEASATPVKPGEPAGMQSVLSATAQQ